MKKTLVVAALMAVAFAAPVAPAMAGDAPAKPKVAPVCYFLPLLPDCVAVWKPMIDAKHEAMHAKHEAMHARLAEAPKGLVMPKVDMKAHMSMHDMHNMPCVPAEKGARHLLDCPKM